MCGIAGQVSTNRDACPDPRASVAMVALLRHRGPDDEGVFTAPGVFLGHTRLSITGIRRGHQPVADESGTVQVVFNGEIYNHQELRRELTARGHRMPGDSDSAVLPAAYREWGLAFPERLDGIFAIGVWDARERRLLLCRDRFGVKPLYYALDPDGLCFGSELKSVAAGRAVAAEVDPGAVGDYLALGYVPGPRTILAGVRMLPPATLLVWRAGGATSRIYWTPTFDALGAGEGESLARIEGALTAAVARESLTETPVGAFLSGGLDSSAICALMAERLGRPFPTFHAAFEEPSFGEQEHARAVSRHLGTRHHEVLCSADHVPRLLPALVWHLDNPVSDVSALAEFMVADLARQSVKVVLSGDGGDEVFAGYPTYKADRVADTLERFRLGAAAAGLLGLVEPLVPSGTGKLGPREKVGRFRRGLAAVGRHPHAHWRTVFGADARADLLVPEARPALEDTWARASTWLDGHPEWPALTRYQWLDMRVWLDGCVLRKVDALAMAHAIEVRVPLLDHRVVEACLSAPPTLRLRRWTEKYALRQIMARRLPESIRRRPKAPFQMPLDRWFRGPLAGFAREQLTDGGLTRLPLLSASAARRVLDDHLSGREAAGVKLWALIVLGSWVEHSLPRLRPAADRPAVLEGRA
jgi:asparagine synthase (glutamine-hydrolysing)